MLEKKSVVDFLISLLWVLFHKPLRVSPVVLSCMSGHFDTHGVVAKTMVPRGPTPRNTAATRAPTSSPSSLMRSLECRGAGVGAKVLPTHLHPTPRRRLLTTAGLADGGCRLVPQVRTGRQATVRMSAWRLSGRMGGPMSRLSLVVRNFTMSGHVVDRGTPIPNDGPLRLGLGPPPTLGVQGQSWCHAVCGGSVSRPPPRVVGSPAGAPPLGPCGAPSLSRHAAVAGLVAPS